MTPVIGDIIQNTVGKVVERLVGKYLPASMDEKEKAALKFEAERLALEEYRAAIADVQGARELAAKETDGAPGWARILTVTHRPAWSFIMLGIFGWTVCAPYFGWPVIELSEVHRSVMQTVIVFYFGGRTVEKAAGMIWGKQVP